MPAGWERTGQRMDEVAVPEWLRAILGPVRTVMDEVNRQLVEVDRTIQPIVRGDPVVQRRCTAPGIGPVTAVAFVSTLDQVDRFGRAHQVESYLGLVPREFSCGERQQRGSVTKAGNGRLRRIENAREAVGRGPGRLFPVVGRSGGMYPPHGTQ